MKKILAKNGYEVWASWDATAEVYELFNDKEDGSCYVGVADTLAEAVIVAQWYVDEQLAEARWNSQ